MEMWRTVPESRLQLIDGLRAASELTEVSTVPEDLDATSHDASPVSAKWSALGRHPYRADAIFRPRDEGEIARLLREASREGVPVTVRALGSSVTGQPLPIDGGIVLDIMSLPQSFEVDERNLTVTASASCRGGRVEETLQARGWTLGHSPQSLHRSSVGGWLATLATGQFSSRYGGIEELVVGFRIVLPTGQRLEMLRRPRAAMGPDLRRVFLGAEGTLGVITSVTLKMFRLAETQLLETIRMPSVSAGLDFLREEASLGLRPFLLRFYDRDEAQAVMADTSFPSPALLVGTQGPSRLAQTELDILRELAVSRGGVLLGPDAAASWMDRRFDFSTVENILQQPGGFAETIEVAHQWSQIEGLYTAMKEALLPLADRVLAHFSHVYDQGTSMYLIVSGLVDDNEGAIARLERIWETAMETCLRFGAELSHHHGAGLTRAPYMRAALGEQHELLKRLKVALDPAGILNPGKLGL